MTKKNLLKGKSIFLLLTNLYLGFRVKGWSFGDRVSNLKKK